MRHVTLPECPECGTQERGVQDPDLGKWHCFACGSSGTYETVYVVTRGREDADGAQ